MDSEEPPNVRVACSGDIDEVVRLMHDAAAWMSAKGTPAWDVARIDRTFAETFVLRSELLGIASENGIYQYQYSQNQISNSLNRCISAVMLHKFAVVPLGPRLFWPACLPEHK
ncbi:hypothetical protein OSC08_25010 [Enterobacter hormaechei]|nr:hypothetical protein [Enterobacter hormaechei]MDS0925082.1 hypothetical protein [Enterobacter hormaechei]